MVWSNKAVLEFLHLYEQKPITWNPIHPLCKDRNEIIDAWRIHKALSFQHIESDLKKKKKASLMVSFQALLSKVKQSAKLGAGTDDI
jgi:hypothetical protein